MNRKQEVKKLEKRKKFFEIWYDRCPAVCQIQLDAVDKRLKTLNNNGLKDYEEMQGLLMTT